MSLLIFSEICMHELVNYIVYVFIFIILLLRICRCDATSFLSARHPNNSVQTRVSGIQMSACVPSGHHNALHSLVYAAKLPSHPYDVSVTCLKDEPVGKSINFTLCSFKGTGRQ